MLYKPTIIVKRLVAKKSNKVVYDGIFHEGLNILSGRNGGGKTSVIQLLAYGLGYEINNWKQEAGSCDEIYVDALINGEPVTLLRRGAGANKQSMAICFKEYSQAIKAALEEWSDYPYSRNPAKESFSQKLFSLMDIPEARSDEYGSITIHQILRLIYSDQSNSSGNIFNAESFDSAFKRELVGDYLLGLYDNELYNAKIELTTEQKKLDKVVAELLAIRSVVSRTSYANDLATMDELMQIQLDEIVRLNKEVFDKKTNFSLEYKREKDVTENYAESNIKIKTQLLECEEGMRLLEYDIQDSNDFVKELTDKSKAINDSIRVGNFLPEVKFSTCPSCFKEIEHTSTEHDCCNLCGTENFKTQKSTNLLRMKNEIDIQLRESNKLLLKKNEKLTELVNKRKQLRVSLKANITKVSSTINSLNTADDSIMYDLYRQIGEADEKIKNLDKVRELHDSIRVLTLKRDETQVKVNRLKDILSLKERNINTRKPEVIAAISKHLINILRADIGAEKEFKNASTVTFDFAAERISVNDKVAFSESGAFYLNNAFHLALLLTSLEKDYLRLPRFMILDGIENGGMEDVRSQKFQHIAKTMLKQYSCCYQLIIATKSIHPDLNNDKFVVGQTYSELSPSLKI